MQPDLTVEKVLIYRLGSLGDTVVALPCFHLVARTFPAAKRVLLTNFPSHAKAPASSAVLGDSGLVHGYMRYSVGTRSVREVLSVAREIRRFNPDVVIYMMPVRPLKNVRRDRYFFRLAGVRKILGLPTANELARSFDSATGLHESEASRLARALADVGDAAIGEQANWNLCLTPAERTKGFEALGALAHHPLIVCGSGTKMQAKDWGRENWQALLKRIRDHYPQYGLALIGAREDSSTVSMS